MRSKGSEKTLYLCKTAKSGCQTGYRLGNQLGEEAVASRPSCLGASLAGAYNPIYDKW